MERIDLDFTLMLLTLMFTFYNIWLPKSLAKTQAFLCDTHVLTRECLDCNHTVCMTDRKSFTFTEGRVHDAVRESCCGLLYVPLKGQGVTLRSPMFREGSHSELFAQK